MKSVLARAGGPVEIERVIPFTTSHSCHVRLSLREESASDVGR